MRILHIIPYFYPAWAYGGTCRAAWELARALVSEGQEVVVYTTDALDSHSRAYPTYEVVDGVEIYRIRNLSNRLAWRRLFLPINFGKQLRIALQRADVAHLHEFRSYQNAVALPLMENLSVPFVLTAQGGLPRIMGRYHLKAVYDRFVGQRILMNGRRLHALNDLEREQLIELGVQPERIAILPNGVDLEEYQDLPQVHGFRERFHIPSDAPIVLFLARVNKIKGVDFLLSSFNEVRREVPGAILVIVGPDDGYLTQAKRHVQTMGIEKWVRFTGYLDGDDKLEAYQAANVYVLPSAYEMFAITLLESLACGTPIIATDRVGLADFVRQNDLGSIVNYGDVKGLKEEILRVLHRPQDVERRAVYGRQYVLENFGWSSIASNWLDVYEACVKGC